MKAHALQAGAGGRRLEALEHPGAVQRPAELEVREDEVVVGLVGGALEVALELAGHRVASGTAREERLDFGEPNSPRT